MKDAESDLQSQLETAEKQITEQDIGESTALTLSRQFCSDVLLNLELRQLRSTLSDVQVSLEQAKQALEERQERFNEADERSTTAQAQIIHLR